MCPVKLCLRTLQHLLALSILSLIAACGSSGDKNGGPAIEREQAPVAPVARANGPSSVIAGQPILLDGSSSSDDSKIIAYQWVQIAGPTAEIANPNQATIQFNAPAVADAQTLGFQLKVTDDANLSSTDNIEIAVNANQAPTIVIDNTSIEVKENQEVLISAEQSTDDVAITAIEWKQISGPSVELSSNDNLSTSFTAPEVTQNEELELTLILSDSAGLTTEKSIKVLIENVNKLPIIVITSATQYKEQELVTIDASSSYDPDGGEVDFSWKYLSGHARENYTEEAGIITFNSTRTSRTIQFSWELTITDADMGVTKQQITIEVEPIDNSPVLEVSGDTSAISLQTFNIYQTSSDPNGTIEKVELEQYVGPKATLLETLDNGWILTAPHVNKEETLNFRVIVRDSENLSTRKIFTVNVTKPEQVTEIHFPVAGSLYESKTLSVQGRSLELGEGISANIELKIDEEIYQTSSDTNGYWQVENIEIGEAEYNSLKIEAITKHSSGTPSQAVHTIMHNTSGLPENTLVAENCDSGELYIYRNKTVYESDCAGNISGIISSDNVGEGVPMPSADQMYLKMFEKELYLSDNSTITKILVEDGSRETIFVADDMESIDYIFIVSPRNDGAFIQVQNSNSKTYKLFHQDLDTNIATRLVEVEDVLNTHNFLPLVYLAFDRGNYYVAREDGTIARYDSDNDSFDILSKHAGTITAMRLFFQSYALTKESSEFLSLSQPRPSHLETISHELLTTGYLSDSFRRFGDDWFIVKNNRTKDIVSIEFEDSEFKTVNSILASPGTHLKEKVGYINHANYSNETARLFLSGDLGLFILDLDQPSDKQIIKKQLIDFSNNEKHFQYINNNNSTVVYKETRSGEPYLEYRDGHSFVKTSGIDLLGSSFQQFVGHDEENVFLLANTEQESQILSIPLDQIDVKLEPQTTRTYSFGSVIHRGEYIDGDFYFTTLSPTALKRLNNDTDSEELIYQFDEALAIDPDAIALGEDKSKPYYFTKSNTNNIPGIYKLDASSGISTAVVEGEVLNEVEDVIELFIDEARNRVILVERDKVLTIDLISSQIAFYYTN